MPAALHVHSWYSLLEATASLERLLQRSVEGGYGALALTDINNLYGATRFHELADCYGIRPILGACLRQDQTHLVALIAEPAGYRCLCRILSRLHLDGERSRLTDLLLENSAGLHLLVENPALARQFREAYEGRIWLEVVRPPRSSRQEREFLEFARQESLPLVASTAAHLASPEEYHTFRLITAIRRLTLLEQLPAQFALRPEHHLVDVETLERRFRDLPEAVRNTDALVEQIQDDILPRAVVLPRPRVPRRLEASGYLRLLCERGLCRRRLEGDPAAHRRLQQELAIIESRDLAGYFLIVRGIARYARHRRYGMALRGSAGNSLVCYLLEITDVNPLRFDLPMERFLHPGRPDLPDIDLDFDWKVRDDVIAHVFERYGAEHTAMISSHLFLQPRSAFREAAKIHGLSNEQVSRLLETLSERVNTLLELPESTLPGDDVRATTYVGDRATTWVPRSFPLEPERWPHLLADARLLPGRPHHLSIHPGGIVVTPDPIDTHAPLERAAKGVVITQYEKDAAEYLGLVKIDLLGNRALSTVGAASTGIRGQEIGIRGQGTGDRGQGIGVRGQGSGVREGMLGVRGRENCPCSKESISPTPDSCSLTPSLDTLPDLDPDTVALLQAGDTVGVNQLESPAMRHLLIQMQPAGLHDVIQALAMIRPGAASVGMKECYVRRRRGLEPMRYAHPCLEKLLDETQGLMLYEDDALRVLTALTGLPVEEADQFRKKVSKHRSLAEAEVLTREYLQACERNGVPREIAGEMWVQLAKFNHYSFCKSHAVSYGLIAWKAAYLKAHFPLAFWTAALNNNQGMYPRRVYVEAIKRAGIPIYLPCVNRSDEVFTMEGKGIRTGLGSIASLDEAMWSTIIEARKRNGFFLSLEDFRSRVRPGPETLSLLIRSGAMDFTGQPRPALYLEADLQDPHGKPEERLFADDPDLDWRPEDYSHGRRLRDEWEALGFVAGPPLMSLFRTKVPPGLHNSRDLRARVGKPIRVSGVVATARHTPTSDGRPMQFVTLEDEWGLIEVTLFPGTCPLAPYLALGPYLAGGRVEEQYGVLTVTANSFQRL
jgi:DNA-directed DNA polymerase III PolC